VLSALSDGKPRTLTEISQVIDINKSTTFRLLATLLGLNYLQVDEATGQYRLGLACLELARSYQTGDELLRGAQPELLRLRDVTKETVHLAVLDGMEIVYLEKLESLHAIGLMSSGVGRRAPAYCTGVGKALLSHVDPQVVLDKMEWGKLRRFNERTITEPDELIAHLAMIRQRGYSLDEGEHESEVRCVAAPIFDRTGEVVAAISVSGPRSRMDPVDQNDELINLTLKVADDISAKLGYNQKNHQRMRR
jgi:DNA-binding IclR family transcriptional regulator